MKRWMLTFHTDDNRFLGMVIVFAFGEFEALGVANVLECNPGGECFVQDIPDELHVPSHFVERLLGREEVDLLIRRR